VLVVDMATGLQGNKVGLLLVEDMAKGRQDDKVAGLLVLGHMGCQVDNLPHNIHHSHMDILDQEVEAV